MINAAEHSFFADANIFHADFCMICWHVEGPPEEIDIETWCVGGNEERSNAYWITRGATGASENNVVGCMMQATIPTLHTVDDPLTAIAVCSGF